MSTNRKPIIYNETAHKFFDNISFGQYIKDMRESDEITQTELAQRVGVTKQFLNAVERGMKSANINLALGIAKALHYPPDTFIQVCLNDLLRKNKVNKIVELKSSRQTQEVNDDTNFVQRAR